MFLVERHGFGWQMMKRVIAIATELLIKKNVYSVISKPYLLIFCLYFVILGQKCDIWSIFGDVCTIICDILSMISDFWTIFGDIWAIFGDIWGIVVDMGHSW